MPQYNKVLSVKDGFRYRKQWEIAMAMQTLTDFGKVNRKAEILGVGAAKEETIWLLSKKVGRVFATDIYLAPGVWGGWYTQDLLKGDYGDVDCDPKRIVFQHMDGCNLRHPDNSFEGIFSSGSIEHFGGFEDAARAAAEMGRVLKKGGVASISTEFKISGDRDGWPGVLLFTPRTLEEFIIKPSGLRLVDEPQWVVDAETIATAVELEPIVRTGVFPPIEGSLLNDGMMFTSVHLALIKD